MTASSEHPEVMASAAAARTPARGSRWRRRPGFAAGILAGLALMLGLRTLVNYTPLADHVVGSLLHSDTTGPADVIVVLGAGMVGPCEPNLNAMRRVILATRLWRDQRAPLLLFTGGKPAGLDCSIAEVMSRFAGDLGIPPEARLVETASRNTHENAVFSAPLLRRVGARRLLIVSDRLHIPRAVGAFAAAGFVTERASVPVYASHPDNVSMLYSGLREYAALLYYRQQGWLGAAPVGPSHAAAPTPRLVPIMLSDVEARDRPVVILGASYAAGWKPARLGGHPVINAGAPGEESWQLLARFDRDVVAHRPRAVILWGFINDIHRAPKDRIDQAVTRARESFVAMIAKARAAGIEPIVTTELTIRPLDSWSETFGSWVGWAMGKESYQAAVNRRVLETNVWLRDLARREGLLVVDLHPALSDADGLRRKAFAKPDGSHITPAGYEALGAYAVPVIDAHLSRRPPP
jgi:uncharacterized SAM-binding protein YcdF (DUF218 family)/lysophospholipase L1-like esterase